MQGLMQDVPLTLPHIFGRAETLFFDKEIVTATATGLERTTYGEWADAHSSARGRARRPRHQRDRARGHVRVEHGAPPRAVLRHPVHGPGAAHAEHPAVPRAARLHREPRRGRGDLRRPVVARAPLAARRPARDRAPHRRDGRRQGRGAEPRRRSAAPRLRGPARRRVAGAVRRDRREPRGGDGLHERYDRQPEGRRLLTPIDLSAHARLHVGRQPGRAGERSHPAGRADVPRQRLGPGARRGGQRRQPRDARSRPVRAVARQAHRGGAGDDRRRGAHHLDGRAAGAEGARHLVVARHPLRGIGGAASAVGGRTAPRRAFRSCRPGA